MYDNPQGPNYFLSTCIINEETQAVVSRAIRETVPDAQSFPAWGGYDFDTDTVEGQALLGESAMIIGDDRTRQLIFSGTPNAQAFSYFLLQHKASLGNLYISQVRVFRDNKEEPFGPNLLFVIEPVPANNHTKESAEPYEDLPSLFARLKKPQGAAVTVDTAVNKPADLPRPKPLVIEPKPVQDLFGSDSGTYLDLYPDANDEEWTKAQCKGANFVRAMRGSDSEAGKIFNPPRDTAASLYNEDDLGKWDLESSGIGFHHADAEQKLCQNGAGSPKKIKDLT